MRDTDYIRREDVLTIVEEVRRTTRKTEMADTMIERIEAIEPPSIPMVLFCPGCGKQHIDVATEDWENPPHRSHKCQTEGCGTIWRTADVFTAGVASVETRGKTDDWTPGMATGTKNPQIMLLAEALMNVLVKAGTITGEIAMSGPELLLAAEDFCRAPTFSEDIRRMEADVKVYFPPNIIRPQEGRPRNIPDADALRREEDKAIMAWFNQQTGVETATEVKERKRDGNLHIAILHIAGTPEDVTKALNHLPIMASIVRAPAANS